MSRYLTVVYKINDEDAAKPEIDRVAALMTAPLDAGVCCVYLSCGHDGKRLALIEEALDARDSEDAIREILDAEDPATLQSA